MKKFFILTIVPLFTLLFSCDRESDPAPSPIEVDPNGTPTEIGKPIGAVSSKSIGYAGGSISSPDGKLTLSFPEGAVTISVQAVENKAWNSFGTGYEFGPDGSRFEKPVTFTYKYSEKEAAGRSLDALGLAFQGHDRVWQLAQPVTVDKVNRTITGRINHFSWWSLVTKYSLTPESASVSPKETRELTLNYLEDGYSFWTGKSMPSEFEIDKLLKLSAPRVASRSDISRIYVNGIDFSDSNPKDQSYGSIGYVAGGSNAKLLYTAPGQIPTSNNPVNIAVELRHSGGAKLMLVSTLSIEADNSMNVDGNSSSTILVDAGTNGGKVAIAFVSLELSYEKAISITVMSNKFTEGSHPFDISNTYASALNGPKQMGGSSHYSHCRKTMSESGALYIERIYRVDGQLKMKGSVSGRVVVDHGDDENCEHTEHKTMTISAKFDCIVRE